jgi:transcriptional regulator with XRE-family HTH domain
MSELPTSLTADQIVSFNIPRARALKGWTQEQAAIELEPYLGERLSIVAWSAAERAVTGKRVRQFSATFLMALCAAFDLPVAFWLRPPADVDLVIAPSASEGLDRERTIELASAAPDERVTQLIAERVSELDSPVLGPVLQAGLEQPKLRHRPVPGPGPDKYGSVPPRARKPKHNEIDDRHRRIEPARKPKEKN